MFAIVMNLNFFLRENKMNVFPVVLEIFKPIPMGEMKIND